MKMNKKLKSTLESVLSNLETANKFIQKDSTIVAVETSLTAMLDETYINKMSGKAAATINKKAGSDLCYLSNAIEKIKWILESENQNL